MKQDNYISVKTFCKLHGVGESFVHTLCEYEIVQVEYGQEESRFPIEELPLMEKMVRLHNELEINPEGIQAIYHLLGQVESLQQEVASLKKRLEALG
ncbi:chaperone modulator CbpM [Flagellimonas okinawensis]|uniref:Chaperone modulator CbpM n=1 Tax=Flagellimonas okinawensis TaxID=3031324 RepID=A0ABT5XTR2_9FLAO|nr:chaperone modulator CbpM [[Muricauda] okinawensis]MDF0709190.1 chaperone modulator CbpM [[Muricauda] okinawensis]